MKAPAGMGRSGLWLPVAAAVAMCAALVLLHYHQQRALDRSSVLARAMGDATHDLAQGFLHHQLGERPGEPWSRTEGRAMLAQALQAWRGATRVLPLGAQATAGFEQEMARLEALLAAERGSEPDARREVELRLAFARLDAHARRIDHELAEELQRQRVVMDRAFLAAVVAALFALAAIGVGVWRVQRRATEALRLLGGISAASTDAIFAKDLEGRYLVFNAAASRITGVPADQVLGQTDAALFPSAQLEEVQRNDRAVIHEGRVQTCEETLRTVDGERVFLAIKGPLLGEDGEPSGIFGISRDISERKREERSAADSEARLSAVIEALDEGIVLTSADGELLHWNRAALEMHGFGSVEEVRGHGSRFAQIFELRTPDGRVLPFDEWPMSRILRGERLHGVEVHIRRRDIDWARIFAYGGAMVGDGSSASPLAMVTLSDITARREAEESVRRLQRVEAIGTMAAGIAHDFNNLLLAIGGNARLARARLADGDSPAVEVEEIERATGRAADVVRRILLFARSEGAPRTRVHLQPLVEEALRLLSATTPATIALATRFDPAPAILADASQLHQVLVNLVTNAVHAIEDVRPPRQGRIEIALGTLAVDVPLDFGGQVVPPGRYADLQVRDDGCGMSPDVLTRLFNPFFTTRPPGRGTGLGMSVVHGIVQTHAGHIAVDSRIGQGTLVRILLPAAQVHGEDPGEPAALPEAARGAWRLFCVDDEQALVSLMSRWLTRLGHEVRSFTDPRAALAALAAAPDALDALVVDLSMPQMSGFDVAAEALRIRPGLPVIMMSGYVRAEDRERAREAGIREVLLKPSRMDELAEAIDRQLSASAHTPPH